MKKKIENESSLSPQNDVFWALNKKGNLRFLHRSDTIKIDNKPDHTLTKQIVAVIFMVLCAALDVAMFYQLFSSFLYDNFMFRILSTLVAAVGFDVGPIYLALIVKRHYEGYKESFLSVLIIITAFCIALIITAVLRVQTKDMVLPSSALSGDTTINPVASGWSMFGILAPVVTSFISFAISYYTYHPLQLELTRCEKIIDRDKAKITQFQSTLKEYECTEQIRAYLLYDEKCKYLNAAKDAQNYGVYLCDYVRQRLKEHLASSSATKALSESACLLVIQNLETTKQAILEIEPPKPFPYAELNHVLVPYLN